MRCKELNVDDLEAILYWHTKAFENNPEEIGFHKSTLIKVQALAIYAQEDEQRFSRLFRRRER